MRSLARVRVGTAVEVREMLVEVAPPGAGVRDHRVQPGALGFERLDLALDPGGGVVQQGTPFGLVTGRPETQSIALARGLVLEQLADLGQREAGVVAQGAEEAQALQVGRVEQPVGAVRSGGGLQEADLLVITDRAGRQAGLGGNILDPKEGGLGGCRGGRKSLGGRPANDTTTFTFTLRSTCTMDRPGTAIMDG